MSGVVVGAAVAAVVHLAEVVGFGGGAETLHAVDGVVRLEDQNKQFLIDLLEINIKI